MVSPPTFLATGRLPPLLFLLVILLAAWTLWPGVYGGFLFDDYPNLKGLGEIGGVHNWETFKAFVLGGFTGPTGRPLAIASFLIDSNIWPAPAFSFKYTNLLLHLLNGCLLTWASLQLCRFYGIPEIRTQYLALFNGAAWLLHPFLVSTTFYIIQRMALLAALFCFAGIAAYLHGRRLSMKRPHAGRAWMLGGICLGTAFATLSKENGALLPFLLLVVEFCRPSTVPAAPTWIRGIFLYLPSLAIVVYLSSQVDFSENPWSHRPFNQPERLLTETRILWEYLGNLLIPQIEGAGLYQDGRTVSKGWTEPPTTLLAALGLALLLTAAFRARRRTPLASLAILFFFTGHLLESTVIGLELYFEHRNYLPSAFLFLPVAQVFFEIPQRISAWPRALMAFGILGTLAFLSHERAKLWGNPEQLELYWAVTAPTSPRAKNTLASYYFRHGDPSRAEATLQNALQEHPDSSLLTFSLLLIKVRTNTIEKTDFKQASERLENQTIDGQAIMGLRLLIESVITRNQQPWLMHESLKFVEELEKHPMAHKQYYIERILPYLKAKLYLSQQRWKDAEQQYKKAIALYKDIDAAMQMVSEMAIAQQPERAMRLLDMAEKLFPTQPERSLRFTRAYYQREINRVRSVLKRTAISSVQSSPQTHPLDLESTSESNQ